MDQQYIRYTEVIYRLKGILLEPSETRYYTKIEEDLFYKTIDDAENAIKQLVFDDYGQNRNRFGFMIYEIPFGANCTQSIRTYTPNGDLFVMSNTSDSIDKFGNIDHFMGRDADELNFQLGDIVAVYGKFGIVSPEVICGLPMDKSTVEQNKLNGLVLPTWDNDSYATIDAYGNYNHRHIFQCLPAANIAIDKSVEDKLISLFEKHASE